MRCILCLGDLGARNTAGGCGRCRSRLTQAQRVRMVDVARERWERSALIPPVALPAEYLRECVAEAKRRSGSSGQQHWSEREEGA